MELLPVESLILDGFRAKVSQVFGAPTMYNTGFDKVKALEKLFGGRSVEYPYIFLTPQNLTQPDVTYSANKMARTGIPVRMSGNYADTVRIIPASFDFELEFNTNKFQNNAGILNFAKMWLFARRRGLLKFTVNYGLLKLAVSVTMSEAITLPSLDSIVDAEASYKLVTPISLLCYVSEQELGTRGIIQEIFINGSRLKEDGSLEGAHFVPFERG